MIRGIGWRGATAVNIITMIGIGPLVTIPLVLADLHGRTALWAWIVGALVALCDGLVWAELGSLYPGSGGTYVFLRESFGAERWGRLLAFLFAWQIVLSAPLVLASGYIGFAHYAGYLWRPLAGDMRLQGIVAAALGIVTVVVLYRPIRVVAAFGIALAAVSIATLAAIIAAAATRFDARQAFATEPHGGIAALAAGLGPALVIALYDYYGYGAACALGDEVRAPARTLPRAVVFSIVAVATLYVALQLGVLAAVPWRSLVPDASGALPDAANYVGSVVVERVWGTWPARALTGAVLITAFASTFGNLLAYSRIPYAAAVDGVFLKPFARLHRSGRFPNVSLAVVGLLALPACFLSLGTVINALTTGLVGIGSIAQIVAIGVLRARGVRAPYRMWLYPLPALIALVGWIVIFFSSGTVAIAFGTLSLVAGVAVFTAHARRAAQWPFAKVVTALLLLAIVGGWSAAQASARTRSTAPSSHRIAPVQTRRIARAPLPSFGSSAIVERSGSPVFTVDGKPFFVYGAAFFYERLPRATWRTAMYELKYGLRINTLDLYVPWNWHELRDGDFDFSGRTNPRRDLREVLRLARVFGFRLIVRPGPVIRNEWRNGGYPAWLLQRPEYGMPLRDRLEGRYPPTATLQNARSDAAAAQWLRNATHLRYTKRWLRAALTQFRPDADQVIAIALDDDQGAYIDNQTWPAPHLRAYLDWLRGVVRANVGPRVPTFINTYQMKVTASSPVWAMGNWYQSAAYALGEHDRAQLEFSTGLLQTRPHQPLMASEFQAGWLEAPQDIVPQAAAPSNTLLAMGTMIGMGVRGIVNFPAQDTMYPAGWEVPFANAFYAWDAALGYGAATSTVPRYVKLAPRGLPTQTVGTIVATFGTMLAAAHVVPDAAIAYLTSAYDAKSMTNADVATVAERTMAAQRSCRRLSLTCELVDLRYADRAHLRRFPILLVPYPKSGPLRNRPFVIPAARTIAFYRSLPATTEFTDAEPSASAIAAALRHAGVRRVVEGAPGASYARDPQSGAGFLSLVNYATVARRYAQLAVDVGTARTAVAVRTARAFLDRRSGSMTPPRAIALPGLTLRPHSAALLPIDVPLQPFAPRFAAGDRFTTSCAVTRVAPNGAGNAVFDIDAATTEDCGFAVRIAGRTYAFRVPRNTDRVGVDSRGRFEAVTAPYRFSLSRRDRLRSRTASTLPVHEATPTLPVRHATRTLPVRNDLLIEEPQARSVRSATTAVAYKTDVYRDGEGAVVLENDRVRVVVAPDAGGRAFIFEDKSQRANAFTTVGALRDDVLLPPPLSTSDHIARYTNQMSAGTFNRPYRADILASGSIARVRFSYDAPDAYPYGAHFARVLTLAPHANCLGAELTSHFNGAGALAQGQRAVTVASLTLGDPRTPDMRLLFSPGSRLATFDARPLRDRNATGLFDPRSHELVLEAWTRAGAPVSVTGRTNSLLVRVPEARVAPTEVIFVFETISSYARAIARAETYAAAPRCRPNQ